jgi:hypothetical protein
MGIAFELALAILYFMRWAVLVGAVVVIVYVVAQVVRDLLGDGPDPMS